MTAVKLTPIHHLIARTLTHQMGGQKFNAVRAATVLDMKRSSASAYLSILSKAGLAYRVREGIFSMVDPDGCDEAENPPKKSVGPRPPAYSGNPEPCFPEPDESKLFDAPGPFHSVCDAVQWLVERDFSIRPLGELYLLEERRRVTEEQLIALVNKRRNKTGYPRPWRSQAGRLPTNIPEPSIQQRMARR